jgi:mannan endo-1,4-beta-mannosidase
MRTISLLFIALAISVISCRSQKDVINGPADKNATAETANLLKNLKKLASKGIMFGHQDDLVYGIGWQNEEGQSDVRKVCGDYPAVYGWELGHLELGDAISLDSVQFDAIRQHIKEVYARGGVNTISWHFNNPLTGGTAWDNSSTEVVKSILPGGSKHELFKTWLDKFADFITSLKDDNGVAIPIIFRPLHEHTGSWFWWGQNQCTTHDYIALWRFMSDYLRDVKNIHNLLYCYSASDGFNTIAEYSERYPGNNYIDMIGFDCYQSNIDQKSSLMTSLNQKLTIVAGMASENNKIAALTEVGFESVPDTTWWTDFLWKSIDKTGISYVLCWRNAWNRPKHYFVPYPGQVSEKDFVDFYNLPGTLFQKNITGEGLYQ